MRQLLSGHVDEAWWLLAALLGVIIVSVPQILPTEIGPETRSLIPFLGLFVAGALVGYLRADRPWRWGLGCMLLVPILDGAEAYQKLQVTGQSITFPNLFTERQLIIYGLMLATSTTGALLGSFFAEQEDKER